MPRRKVITRRERLSDPKYGSTVVMQFVNSLMMDGKKSVAESIMYGALDILNEKVKEEDPLDVFIQALNNAKPLVEVKSRRVGGSTYQIPVEVPPARRTSLAIRWIIDASRRRNEKTMKDRLAGELMDCYNSVGTTIKKKEDTHRMAEANKAFAHYRW
ncbi:MAG: 30S ribosomal protein S7 [Candidatus Hydrogenedentes bacterium]|nr:30S ribosomal protein S7 [Candidatus Hydrogenedentota bacterium]